MTVLPGPSGPYSYYLPFIYYVISNEFKEIKRKGYRKHGKRPLLCQWPKMVEFCKTTAEGPDSFFSKSQNQCFIRPLRPQAIKNPPKRVSVKRQSKVGFLLATDVVARQPFAHFCGVYAHHTIEHRLEFFGCFAVKALPNTVNFDAPQRPETQNF